MKKNCDLGLYPPRWLKNFLKVMRITGILCLVCVMHLSAAVHSQTARINLKMKDATIEQVLNKTGYMEELRNEQNPRSWTSFTATLRSTCQNG